MALRMTPRWAARQDALGSPTPTRGLHGHHDWPAQHSRRRHARFGAGVGPPCRSQGFPGVASLDRLVYPGYEALISLAAAVTERVRMTPQVLLAPWRLNAALIAKQVATLRDDLRA
jgi:hypothetical protein